eukprot:6074561-Alexandrium_andersonii.AAC.1
MCIRDRHCLDLHHNLSRRPKPAGQILNTAIPPLAQVLGPEVRRMVSIGVPYAVNRTDAPLQNLLLLTVRLGLDDCQTPG